jgi:hypothetical protein
MAQDDDPTVPSALGYAILGGSCARVARQLELLLEEGLVPSELAGEALALSFELGELASGFARWPTLSDEEVAEARENEPQRAWACVSRALEIATEASR